MTRFRLNGGIIYGWYSLYLSPENSTEAFKAMLKPYTGQIFLNLTLRDSTPIFDIVSDFDADKYST